VKRLFRTLLVLLGLVGLASLLNGCGAIGVNVWEHDILSKPEMQFDYDAADHAFDDHIYFSKEGSSGGRGFGGGGCGCN
jgi:hypothetical protein